MLEGKWLHRYIVELALWGALLKLKGYDIQHKDEDHMLALSTFIREDGKEPDQEEMAALQKAYF